ncbi:hypothetical protein [Flavilitoribacter nigricans]|uniref:DUF3108 domain-containing protein n=1 Tax=Flavilitoribacter nigricans (strain ATCC 23147 / DSM 23189 / NBRC 102662 / NCIMB 1420 / SS-2) TaxID=1122177 RepID=A0A2D0N6R4_FLAN2|nr:hypothetical protein [Flavilitoribacter nigricans]PHN04088.1 hypothetical protein CRP01_23100 [Flavilitoribacter nigricans DSM 23189 = NBRC 102662]
MQRVVVFLAFLFVMTSVIAQTEPVTPALQNYYQLLEGSPGSGKYRVSLSSDIDTSWTKWTNRGYNFGFDNRVTPMYTYIDGIVSTPYMVQVRGNEFERNKKRWGFHVFEGYAKDDKSRITLLVNKHIEMEKPVAEMYYYGTVYNHSAPAYNWFRIGSDVRQHSFLFSRDKALFYGSLQLTNTLTLGNVGKEDLRPEAPEGDDEQHYAESAKHVNYQALKAGGDGTMFYDKDHNIVVIKINGEWMKMTVEPLPADIKYEFE